MGSRLRYLGAVATKSPGSVTEDKIDSGAHKLTRHGRREPHARKLFGLARKRFAGRTRFAGRPPARPPAFLFLISLRQVCRVPEGGDGGEVRQ